MRRRPVLITAPFATAKDAARILGVSKTRLKAIERMIDDAVREHRLAEARKQKRQASNSAKSGTKSGLRKRVSATDASAKLRRRAKTKR